MALDNRLRTSTLLMTLTTVIAMLGCQAQSPADNEAETAVPASTTAGTQAAPSTDELANATFEGIHDQPVALADGSWEGEPFEPGAASRPAVGLVRHFWMGGDLNGDGTEEAVVLLWKN